MEQTFRKDATYIVDREMLMSHNEKGCEACHHKFNLGDQAVMACGPWPDNCAKLIHKSEAVFDKNTGTYFEKNYFQSLNK